MTHTTAAILVIGNEVLSGRTREANAWHAARQLFANGCRLGEVAVVPDIAERIIDSLNRLRRDYDAVITSGGIGPTHDDITMQSVADTFGVPLCEDETTIAEMERFYGADKLNDHRRRMARLPQGASPIISAKSIAPGARIGNVYVLAGVPSIFESQLEVILPRFGTTPFLRREVEHLLPESAFAGQLDLLQQQYSDVEIGSYPGRCGDKPCGKICLSSQDADRLAAAVADVEAMLAQIA
jgi:molybdenum cofactor synthesis domain-containing protein